MTRIKDVSLAGAVTRGEESWWQVTSPVLSQIGQRAAGLDLRGLEVVCFQHVLLNSAPAIRALARAGARVRVAAVNPDSTDDIAAAYLVRERVEVWAWNGMTEAERIEGLDWLLREPADALSDMGGELIAGAVERNFKPRGALEATMSGLHRLAGLHLGFPVFNWNDVALKDRGGPTIANC